MRIILGCLMCLVLPLSQAFAISGGPVYGGNTSVVGTYAGVVKPGCVACSTTSADKKFVKCKEIDQFVAGSQGQFVDCTDPFGCTANSLGVFSLGVPTTGISTGTFVMFSQGRVFNGTINGTADPGTSRLKGILSARFDFTVSKQSTDKDGNPVILTESVTAMANGNLNAKILPGSSSSSSSNTATRLTGSSLVDISQGQVSSDLSPIVTCEMDLVVNGFKQSSSAPTTGTVGGG
jgi:hypothetical protein